MKYLYPVFFCMLFNSVKAQVELLTETSPGTGYASIQYLTRFQGKVFFFAGLGSSSTAVWRLYKTDGTAAGTEIVYESDSLAMQNGEYRNVAVAGNKMYFITKKDWLWVTDGTNIGTMPLQAFYRNDTLQYLDDLCVADNGYAYISLSNKGMARINTSTNAVDTFYNKLAGVELIFVRRGTAFTVTNPYTHTAETGIFDLNQNKFLLRKSVDSFSIKQYPLSNPQVGVEFLNDNEFIALSQGYSNAPELPVRIFKYSMLNDTKVLLAEEPEGSTWGTNTMAGAGGKVYFGFRRYLGSGLPDALLYVTDGTVNGTYTLSVPKKNHYSSLKSERTFGNKLLFQLGTLESQSMREELWITDGTQQGTIKLAVAPDTLAYISTGKGSEQDGRAFADTLNGYLYFEHNGRELWRTDGTVNGTTYVCEVNRLQGFDQVLNLNGELLFTAPDYTCVGNEVWAYVPGNACTVDVTCPAGVNDMLAGNLQVYPNPAATELNVQIPEGEEVLELSLLSVEGRV